jgi:hypothetical protein
MTRCIAIALLLAAVTADLSAQGRGGNRGGNRGGDGVNARCSFGARWDGPYFVHPAHPGNIPYDGRFTMTRVQYAGSYKCGDEGPGWSHDYPVAEVNFMLILRELTNVRPHMNRFNIVRLDSPDLFKYPALYLSEPGGWDMNENEVKGLRAFLLKGGFMVVDDFPANDYPMFAYQMSRVLPDAEVMALSLDHPIFDSFFHITEPWKSGSQSQGYGNPEFYAIFEDNDPFKRVMVMVNYGNDLGENWQFSSQGFVPLDRANESWRLGINYYIYALTR